MMKLPKNDTNPLKSPLARYRAATLQTVQVFFVSLLYFILSLIEKPGGGKSTLIHRAHSRLSYLHRVRERPLFVRFDHGEEVSGSAGSEQKD